MEFSKQQMRRCTHIHVYQTSSPFSLRYTNKKNTTRQFIYWKNSLLFRLSLVLLCATVLQATGLVGVGGGGSRLKSNEG